MKTVIVGGGYAGCAAAIQSAKMGAQTVLLERTDTLLGTGQAGGIFNNNGRCTLALELQAMGAGELLEHLQKYCLHSSVSFAGHAHAQLIDAACAAREMPDFLRRWGVQAELCRRVDRVERQGEQLVRVFCDDGSEWEADAFVDAVGSAGPMSCCVREGRGCVMCVMRCPAYGGRISPAALAGGREQTVRCKMSGSCKLVPESLAPALRRQLQKQGAVCLPLPEPLSAQCLEEKACRQYALSEFAENVFLLDTGFVKLMAPYIPLSLLRRVKGLEKAEYADPYAGGKGNSVRLSSKIEREDTLRVPPLQNVFCAGERAGLLVGHTEALVSGTLAGYNAACVASGKSPVAFSVDTVCGALLQYEKERTEPVTASGGDFFEQMKRQGRYSTDGQEVAAWVQKAGMAGIFDGAACFLPQ